MSNIWDTTSVAVMQVDKTTTSYRAGYVFGQVLVYAIIAILIIWGIRKLVSSSRNR